MIDKPILSLEAMIGFNGAVPNGLQVHPYGDHIVYPVGCTVVVENINSKRQEFLSGHTDSVTCIAISKSGKYLASGQQTHMGFKADIIIWDFDARSIYATLKLHMVKVQAMAFSPSDMYLATLGGADDGSVVVWNLATKQAICGSPAQVMSAGRTNAIAFTKHSDTTFVTGGESTLRVWELDVQNRKIRPTDVNMSQTKRVVNCIEFIENDDYFICGTTSGDIIAIKLKTKIFQKIGPQKNPFSLGITSLKVLQSGDILVGSGDGTIAVCKGLEANFKRTESKAKLQGAVTSIALRGKGHQFFAGTNESNIYKVPLFAEKNGDPALKPELITTCHYAAVNDIAFPADCSDIYCTCSYQDIRVWNMQKNQELLRITVRNMTCNAVIIMPDGKMIISAWDDGRIRAFAPESGKPIFVIEDAHRGGVSALAAGDQNRMPNTIISGGKEGKVRVWEIKSSHNMKGELSYTTQLKGTLSEHKAEVTAIKVRRTANHCVTSCIDGSCIIWDLISLCRVQMIRVNTLFKYVCFHPNEHQIITTGTDRKIGYYETIDASAVRDLDGSKASINTLDISSCGKFFISAGDDKLVKVWKYDEGEPTHIGVGHSASITQAKICPNTRYILSVSTDGAVLRWKFPAY